MRTSLWVKLAASSMIVGGLTVAQNAYADFSPKGAAVASREAARMAARAEKLLAKDAAKALVAAEHAVALAPTDADHRMLLGRAYLANGRFRSAATSFSDVLALDPSRGNAALSLALAKIALGDKDSARALVDEHQQRIAPSDRGLALALTGDAPGGVGVLEAVVRGGGSDAKTRQNLALAYALAGRWLEAKLMASYDLDAATVSKRIMDWSKLAREDAGATHVAALLGVQPTATDEGMPVRLALAPAAPEAAPVRMAEAAPPPPPARLAEPVEVAQAPALAAPVEDAPRPSVSFAAPSEVVQQPRVLPVVKRYEGPQPKPAAYVVPAKGGRFAVQIGAFSTPGRVEAAWSQTVSRVGSLARFTPASATVRTAGGTFYRLSVTGFETRDSAVQLCLQLRARGGQCFVRGVAGDAPLQWAANRGPRIASR